MKIRAKDVQPGDVLSLYIGNNVFAFMRLLYVIPCDTYLCEVYDFKGSEFVFDPQILASSRLMPIVSANWLAYLNPKLWRGQVIFRDNDFKVPIEEIREVRLMNLTQAVRFNMDWQPDSSEMLVLTEDVWDKEKHDKLSQKHMSFDLLDNPEMLICEIRNRLGLLPKFNHRDFKERISMFKWLKANDVYLGPRGSD